MSFSGHLDSHTTPWSRRRRASQRGSYRLNRLELLEQRQLLAANVLDSVQASVANPGETREVRMTVEIPNGTASTLASLMIAINPTDGSSLDPNAVSVRTAAGNNLTTASTVADHDGLGSLTSISLPSGQFDVLVSGENATAGSFEMTVYLAGDIFPLSGVVDNFEFLYTQAALTQASGTGNFVTYTFYQSQGIDMSQNLFNTGLDVDGDGRVGSTDLLAVQRNNAVGTVEIELLADVDAPALTPRLSNDTGVSNTDRITTDPTIVGTLTDESPISSFQVRIDNGPLTNALSRLVDENFTLDRSFLNTLAGGTLAAGQHTIQFVATDESGNTIQPPVDFTFVFIDQNVAPTAGAVPNQTATEDSPFTANLGSFFSDANPGDVILFSSPDRPAWLTINPTTGVATGTPGNADVGARSFTVRGTDSQGLSVDATVNITVANVNDPPVISPPIPNQNATVGNPFSLNLRNFISDPDAGDTFDTLEIAVQQVDGIGSNGELLNARPLPAWITYNETTGVLSGTPALSDVGTFTVGVVVVDAADGTTNQAFTITVAGNRPPTVTPIPDATTPAGIAFNQNLSTFFTDPDGDTLTFSIAASPAPLPTWLTFNTTTGVLSGTPAAGDVGTVTLTVTATDPSSASVSDTFTLTVTPPASVNIALRTLDTNGNEITSIATGAQFDLVVTVQDVRPASGSDPRGIFSAFVDVTYNGTLATPTGSFDHDFNGDGVYTAGTSGATTGNGTANALLDEVGGTDGISPLGTGVFELFRIRFTAGSTAGTLTFASDPADQRTQHPILLFGGLANVPDADVNFGTTVLTVGALTPPLSAIYVAPQHNAANPLDVNGDSIVSPIDALLVINQMNSSSAQAAVNYLDVNADGNASPIDALLVINHLSVVNTPAAPLSSGVVFGGDDDQDSSDSQVQDAAFATGDFW